MRRDEPRFSSRKKLMGNLAKNWRSNYRGLTYQTPPNLPEQSRSRYNQRASSVPSGIIVASRSGPVEIIPISTCKKSAMNRK